MDNFINIFRAVGCAYHDAVPTYAQKLESRRIDVVSAAEYDLVHPELLDDEIQELMASQLQQVPPRPLQQRHLIFTDLPSPGITFDADGIANVIWTRADLVLIGNIIIFRMSYIHTETIIILQMELNMMKGRF
jgi:hypothetical protein